MKTLVRQRMSPADSLWDTQRRQEMENFFLYSAAPILRGVKPAALIPLQPQYLALWRELQGELRQASGLRTTEIINAHGSTLLYIYDEAAVRALLSGKQAATLLSRYGYPAGGHPDALLRHLQSRFMEAEFPHEIGVFLGYPTADVWSFIVNKGKNCVCCRYWKVYHNVEKAQETFRLIDEAQDYAANLLAQPLPADITANLLRVM